MNYITHFNIFGVDAQQIPCHTGSGAPTIKTEGDVGCLYMDIISGKIYKCTAASNGNYTWKLSGTPESTASDNGKFLRVVNGEPAWVSVVDAKEVAF
jgi:hypothetical protein